MKKELLALVAGLTLTPLYAVTDENRSADENQEPYTYDYCFRVSETTELLIKVDGQFLSGEAHEWTNGACYGNLLGDIHSGKFFLYRDWDSYGNCVEGVWYTGNLSDYTYSWINTAGERGTGVMEPITCPPL